jgi:hypothetical protein
MDKIYCNCTKCEIIEKICRVEDGKGPAWCPTRKETATLKEALSEYGESQKFPLTKFVTNVNVNARYFFHSNLLKTQN